MANSSTNKKYAFETVSDPSTRANFDLISKQLDKLRRDHDKVNYVTSDATVESPVGSGVGFLCTSIYPTFTQVVPLTVPITTTGKPVLLSLAPRKGDNVFQGDITINCDSGGLALLVYIRFYRDNVLIYETNDGFNDTAAGVRKKFVSPNSFWHLDTDATSGKHVYTCQAAIGDSHQTAAFNWVRMWAKEMAGNSLTL